MLMTPVSARNWEKRLIHANVIGQRFPLSLSEWVFEWFTQQPPWKAEVNRLATAVVARVLPG